MEIILSNNHKTFLNKLLQATKGIGTEEFRPPPIDIPLEFEPKQVFSIDPPSIKVDTSGLKREYGEMERHKRVRLDYERDRYMEHLKRDQLISRGNDIFCNHYQVDYLGHITVEHSNPLLYYWFDMFTEFLHECFLRGESIESIGGGVAKDFPFPKKSDMPKQIGQCLAGTSLPTDTYLVRYGKKDHIRKAYEEGILRLGPASSYTDPSLNLARRDDELSLDVDIDPAVIPVMGPNVGNVGERIKLKVNIKTNFYVLCLSTCLRSRLFLDFNADSCLIIRKPQELKDRFIKAIHRALPGFHPESGRIEYYDPLCVAPAELVPIFWKHFRYAYQEEVRFIAVPQKSKEELKPVFIKLGSLKDISEVLEIE